MSNIVKNNDLLPENFPTTGKKETGRASAFILPQLKKQAEVNTSATSDAQAEAQRKIDEYDRYKFHVKMNRLEVFRGCKKTFRTQEAKDTFMDSLNKLLEKYEIDHNGDTDLPEFYTIDKLDKHVAKVARGVLISDALKIRRGTYNVK